MTDPRQTLARIQKRADTAPVLLDALEAVLAMHTPKDNGRVSMCCSCEQWIESSDDQVCIEYPCPTVEAITTALEDHHA